MTQAFFKVTDLDKVLARAAEVNPVGTEKIALSDAAGRVLSVDVISDTDLPDFYRATMDGYAVRAASTFGASEANPAYLTVKGVVEMGKTPLFAVGSGEAARISTGGMLPPGADSVVMVEHAEAVDDTTVEAYRSVAPGQHTIEPGEDFKRSEIVLERGSVLGPSETGLLAAFGLTSTNVYKKPVVAVISTGDEIVAVNESPGPGQIRDVNTYTLSAMIEKNGGRSLPMGIVRDDYDALFSTCSKALSQADMVLLSGGSSVGTRDFTIQVMKNLPDAKVLVHGIPISPGKPTILARAGGKMMWGLPGHVVSAMVVFTRVVKPFVQQLSGRKTVAIDRLGLPARITRNLSSAQGRIDYVRVRLKESDGILWAAPVLGKSALLNTMVKADGLIEIGMNSEGLDKGAQISVLPLD